MAGTGFTPGRDRAAVRVTMARPRPDADAKGATDISGATASNRDAAAYAAPTMGAMFLYIPMWGILPGIYAKYFDVKLTALAAVLILIRVFDAIVDLAVGFLSDWHQSRGGSRKTWVIVGGLCLVVACYFLYVPSPPVSASYYLKWALVYFLAWAIFEIPHQTWGSQLTSDYQGRARVYAFRSFFMQVGVAAFYALPLLPIYATTQYTPEIMHDAVYFGAALSLIGVAWTAMGPSARGQKIHAAASKQPGGMAVVRALLANRPLHLIVSAIGLSAAAYGMWIGIAFIYIDSYLGLGTQFALIFFASTVWTGVATPIALRVIGLSSKPTAWLMGLGIFLMFLLAMAFVQPGQLGWTAFLIVFIAPFYLMFKNVAAPAMMADIADYGKLKLGRECAGSYFSLQAFIFKISVGLGGAMSIGLTGLFDYDPASPVHSAHAILGLKLAFLGCPALLIMIAAWCVWRSPITRARHDIIMRRLATREQRSRAAAG